MIQIKIAMIIVPVPFILFPCQINNDYCACPLYSFSLPNKYFMNMSEVGFTYTKAYSFLNFYLKYGYNLYLQEGLVNSDLIKKRSN